MSFVGWRRAFPRAPRILFFPIRAVGRDGRLFGPRQNRYGWLQSVGTSACRNSPSMDSRPRSCPSAYVDFSNTALIAEKQFRLETSIGFIAKGGRTIGLTTARGAPVGLTTASSKNRTPFSTGVYFKRYLLGSPLLEGEPMDSRPPEERPLDSPRDYKHQLSTPVT